LRLKPSVILCCDFLSFFCHFLLSTLSDYRCFSIFYLLNLADMAGSVHRHEDQLPGSSSAVLPNSSSALLGGRENPNAFRSPSSHTIADNTSAESTTSPDTQPHQERIASQEPEAHTIFPSNGMLFESLLGVRQVLTLTLFCSYPATN
jgi:hypothetical protein